MRTAKAITSFSGKNFFLSNFYRYPVLYRGNVYKTSEHAFQAQKAWTIVDHAYIQDAPTPAEAKKRAREITRIDSWEEVKIDIMSEVLRMKFVKISPVSGRQNILADWLLATGDAELIEGNTWGDTFWGQCPLGTGQNMLGQLLMQTRSELCATTKG